MDDSMCPISLTSQNYKFALTSGLIHILLNKTLACFSISLDFNLRTMLAFFSFGFHTRSSVSNGETRTTLVFTAVLACCSFGFDRGVCLL